MLLVHQELYGRDQLGAIPILTYTKNLMNYLTQSYSTITYEVQPELDIDEGIHLKTDYAIPLGLMMTELITNSLKYAHPIGKILSLSITLNHLNEHDYTLTYADNGQGLPHDIDIAQGKTMGLRLLRDLTRQLKGTIAHSDEQSSFFIITFKDF